MQISVLAELERCGIDYEQVGSEEVKVRCPFHDDDRASASINVKKQVFRCHAGGCHASGDFITYLCRTFNQPRAVITEDLSRRYGVEDAVKTIDPSTVERYHQAIWGAKVLLSELYNRGISDDSIRKYRLGFDRGRITIPVYNESRYYVNIRRYLPGAPGADKIKNLRGRGKMRLFPIDQLKYDKIVVTGGELKAIAIAQRLNNRGVGSITCTGGEGNWDASFTALFKDKEVWVCMDVDHAGKHAANIVAGILSTRAKSSRIIELPLDVNKYPTGDVNDYFGAEEHNADEFLKLMDVAREWKPAAFEEQASSEIIQLSHLSQAIDAKLTGKRISVKSIVSALDNAPYVIPKKVRCACDKSQPVCHICPVFAAFDTEEFVDLDINPESPGIMEMVGTSKASQSDAIKTALRIPECKVVEFTPLEYYNVEDVRLAPQLEMSSRQADSILQPALCIGHGLEANESYEMIGRMYPNPRNQQSILLISEYKPTQDALSSYADIDVEGLDIFQPDKWTLKSLAAKLDEIYDDLSFNVTRIYQRRDLHLAIDLAYHSVLLFYFDGRRIKGWTEVLIAGDSSQGKSETTQRLMEHYGLGERVECKNASVAGLLGGLQQVGSRWFVTWGVIPTHDKRLVVLEELKGASVEVIGHLTDMRSSGVAEIPKIEKRRTHARTRLIAISNPRSDRPVSTYSFGIEVIKELIGGLEDIRRFDMAILLSADQVDAKELNRLCRNRPQVEHRYTSDLCKKLLLWTWTRLDGDVVFEDEDAIVDAAARLSESFTEVIPLIDRGSMRYKIARLATALACRTFSSKGNQVIVRRCHVDYIAQTIDRIYSDGVFGYKDFSYAIKTATTLVDHDVVKKAIFQTPFPRDFIDALLHTNDIELRDICDWCGWERSEGLVLLSLLVRKHALIRNGRAYSKNPAFIELLKGLRDSEELERHQRPDFIGEEF